MLNRKGVTYQKLFFELKQIASERQKHFSPTESITITRVFAAAFILCRWKKHGSKLFKLKVNGCGEEVKHTRNRRRKSYQHSSGTLPSSPHRRDRSTHRSLTPCQIHSEKALNHRWLTLLFELEFNPCYYTCFPTKNGVFCKITIQK